MQILVRMNHEKTQTIKVQSEQGIGKQIQVQMGLKGEDLDKLYAKSKGRRVNLNKTFTDYDILTDDEIELFTKGPGGMRKKMVKGDQGHQSKMKELCEEMRKLSIQDPD